MPADSDDVAQAYRYDVAHGNEFLATSAAKISIAHTQSPDPRWASADLPVEPSIPGRLQLRMGQQGVHWACSGLGLDNDSEIFGREALAWEALRGYCFRLRLSPFGGGDFGRFR
jgi:hypothetical protein